MDSFLPEFILSNLLPIFKCFTVIIKNGYQKLKILMHDVCTKGNIYLLEMTASGLDSFLKSVLSKSTMLFKKAKSTEQE